MNTRQNKRIKIVLKRPLPLFDVAVLFININVNLINDDGIIRIKSPYRSTIINVQVYNTHSIWMVVKRVLISNIQKQIIEGIVNQTKYYIKQSTIHTTIFRGT